MPHGVLVTAAGSATAYGVIRSLKQRWGGELRLLAGDVNPRELVAAAALTDAFVRLPLSADEAFEDALVEALEAHDADTYVPILDDEVVDAAVRAQPGGALDGRTVVAPSAAAAAACADKLACAERLLAADLPAAPTSPAEAVAWEPGAWVLKPRRGLGSAGVVVPDSSSAFAAAVADGDDLVAQARCAPPEVTIDAFRSRDGVRTRAVCRERLQVKAGVCTKARVFDDRALGELALGLGEILELVGTYCVQTMRDPGGAWRITDVNARPGAGARMSAAIGIDFPAAHVADAWSWDVTPLLAGEVGERYVTRAYEEFVAPVADG